MSNILSAGNLRAGVAGGPMKYDALATDYDGTIAFSGHVARSTVEALCRMRHAGARLLLVTGRELTDLGSTFNDLDVFHRIVAENGAVVYEPLTRRIETLAPPPPAALLERLRQERVPFSVGNTLIATVEPHEQQIIAAIRDLRLDWHVIFNKGSVMALPSDVTKATGLRVALRALSLSPETTIAVGDAENDLALLRACGLAVAVANALPTVKAAADVVTHGAGGEGVIELIERWLAHDLDSLETNRGAVP